MKVMEFGIKSSEEADREFIEAFEAARRGLPYDGPRNAVYFTSLEVMREFLTPKRLALLRMIKEKNPSSIYQLAKMARRSFPAVSKDIKLLRRHGLVSMAKQKSSPRGAVQPSVGYDAISLWIGV
ncbi:MAG: ArsR family transcriptional regulator [Elusimicrobia bacterium]|nr:ArsR family transcriptional regulator [Elusimicrobiota bacterium]